jgi:lipoprotein LprG
VRNLLLAVAALTLALSGCSGDDPAESDETPEDRLAAAKTGLDEAEFIEFQLETESLPDDLEGLLSATGTGTHDPAFTGEVKVQTGLADITAPLVAVDDTVYAELPFAGWSEIDPAEYGAPDPANLMDPDTGISSLFTATTDVSEGDSERDGERVLTQIDGTIPGDAVQAVFPSAGTSDFAVTYLLDEANVVDSVRIDGPFYDGYDDVTYRIDLDLEGDEVQIEAPI